MNRETGRLFYVILGGMILIALIIYSAPAVAAGPSPKGTVAPAMPSEEPPLTNTPMPSPTPTGIPSYFSNPGGPSCVGGGCTLPSGYNVVVSAIRNEQSIQAYDPKTGSVFGTGRVETTILVSGAGIGTVSVYYGLSGVSCSGGHSVDIAKRSGNETHLNVPLSGYVDVTLTSLDFGEFTIYTRCKTAGSYVGNFGIDSVWYSLIDVATPTPTAAPTSTPTIVPTSTPMSSGYNRVAAVNYSDIYAHEPRNVNYPLSNNTGCNCNNCTNYLSQVLHYGNYPLHPDDYSNDSSEWWYKPDNLDYSTTWASADSLLWYIRTWTTDFSEMSSITGLESGDFILLDLRNNINPNLGPDGIPDHARVVVGSGPISQNSIDYIHYDSDCNATTDDPLPSEKTTVLINQNCIDRWHVAWYYGIDLESNPTWYVHVEY